MTKDRALRVLDVYASVNGSGQCTQDEFEEAKKMAIEALESQDRQVIIAGSYLLEGEDNVPDTNVGDIISRQAAIDSFWKLDIEMRPSAIDAITGILEQLPSAQQWIPCSERPPKEDFWSGRERQFSEHVLVTIVNRGNDDERFTDMAQTVDGIWQLSHDVDGDCSLPNWCEVIAWMPLPEPYKGEES